MLKKMTNQEMLIAFNSLNGLQELERKMLEKKQKRLLQGRVKISYAINKNISALKAALQPFADTEKSLNEEMRDTDAEQKAITEAKEKGENLNEIEMIFKDGFSAENYISKRKELLEIENEVEIHEVDLELFDGIELNSDEIGLLMFMIRD